jgi:hypothetical protein
MTPSEFIKKWQAVALTERAAAQSHFLDLCKLFEHDGPVTADPTGDWFTFEKGATKTGGGEGFADVWKRDFFAWEYKRKKHNLDAAMDQLVRYAAALENPPLQVVCDTDRFIIRTAWTNSVPVIYEIELDDLAQPKKREILHAVFHDPDARQGKKNSDVVKRSWLSTDFMSRDRDAWIVDFGVSMTEKEASLYEEPFEYLVENVKNKRSKNAREARTCARGHGTAIRSGRRGSGR